MGLGGAITGTMGLFGDYPQSSPPNASQVGPSYLSLLSQFIQGQPQLLSTEQTYKPQYASLDTGLMTSGTTGSLPGYVSAFGNALPGTSGLMNQLTQSATDQLGAGAGLDPALARVTSQSIRGSEAARGLGYGPADVLQESSALTTLGNQLRQQRQQFGLQAVGQGASTYLSPAISLAGQTGMLGAGATPTLIPSSQNYDLLNTAYNAQASSNIANQNAQLAMLQGFNSMD